MKIKSKSLIVLACAALLSACGSKTGANGNSAAATLDYIRSHGFPRLADLIPSLPPQLARITGVATDATGLPALPDDLGGASFGELSSLVGEARALAVQGFSESRRLEASTLSLANPIHDVLGQTDLFEASGAEDTSGSGGGAAMLADASEGGVAAVNIFDQLLSSTEFAIKTAGTPGMPAYIMLGVDDASKSVDISGLWGDEGAFHTGFQARVRLDADDDFGVTLTLAPSRIAGLVADWSKTTCADDVWQITVGEGPTAGKSLELATQECPSARNAVASIKFAQGDAGAWQFTGGFAQTFAGLDAGTLRGFLGERQGFALQAAASDDLSQLAAAAAVLGESDFAAPSQTAIDQFGVGQLLARYFQAKYFEPKRRDAKSGDIFSNYDNAAYWTCYAPVVADEVKSDAPAAKDLCASKSTDVEPALTMLKSLKSGLDDSGLAPDDVKTTVDKLVSILSIRNTLFVDDAGSLAFKTAPNAAFTALDDARKTALPSALGDTAWVAGANARLKTLTAAEIPDTPFKAISSGIGKFLKKECQSLVNDATAKAGTSGGATSACGG